MNEGWRVAMTTLAYERGTVAKLHLGLRGEGSAAARRGDARRRSATVAWLPTTRYCASNSPRVYLEAELLKLISDRAISAELHGRRWGRKAASRSSCGARPSNTSPRSPPTVLGPDALEGPWARDRVYVRALTIAGGTTQVNKNILAQRILGLPRG